MISKKTAARISKREKLWKEGQAAYTTGNKPNYKKAIKLLLKSEDLGCSEAIADLIAIYERLNDQKNLNKWLAKCPEKQTKHTTEITIKKEKPVANEKPVAPTAVTTTKQPEIINTNTIGEEIPISTFLNSSPPPTMYPEFLNDVFTGFDDDGDIYYVNYLGDNYCIFINEQNGGWLVYERVNNEYCSICEESEEMVYSYFKSEKSSAQLMRWLIAVAKSGDEDAQVRLRVLIKTVEGRQAREEICQSYKALVAKNPVVALGDFRLDANAQKVYYKASVVDVGAPRTFMLLHLLMLKPNTMFLENDLYYFTYGRHTQDIGDMRVCFNELTNALESVAELEIESCLIRGLARWYELTTPSLEQRQAKEMFSLAEQYLHGRNGKEVSVLQAVNAFKQAKKLGHTEAFLRSVKLSRYADMEESALAGDPNAQCILAENYMVGGDLPMMEKEAVKLFTKSANQNFARAQYNLGNCYMEGWGVNKDVFKALHWYSLAANQGHAKAIELAKVADTAVNKKNTQAKYSAMTQSQLKALAKKGDGYAAYIMGYNCQWGLNGEKIDIKKGIEWYETGIESKNSLCAFGMATILDGSYEEQVINFFKMSMSGIKNLLEDSDPHAQYCYAWYDYTGLLGPTDYDAIELLKDAAQQGHLMAHYFLGKFILLAGDSDMVEEAADWLKKAAEKNVAPAQHLLGRCYEEGRGVPKNTKKAQELLNMAAKQGYQV